VTLLGLILFILGWVLAIPLLFWIGVVLLVVGAVLLVASHAGHGRHYW
jgi:hypothetical protein